jgi:acyl-homoserine lactone synthase
MIHIITASNRHLYTAQLDEMHRLRRIHFIEERGWSDLKVVNGGEYDEYDDERTVYILALGPAADVLAGMRARPTDDKCMLTDVFPDLVSPDEPSLKSPDVWEISRIFTTAAARANKAAGGGRIALEIVLAAMEWTNEAGIDRLCGVIPLHIFAPSRSWGWNIRMTGLPLDTPDGPIIGIEAANTRADVEAFRRTNSLATRVAHVVTDTDIAAFGSLEKIEAEFALLRADSEVATNEVARPVDRSA